MKVLVAGAGPAGAATALLLARCGVEIRLVERERSFERVFRGEGLMPLGIDALIEMGLGGVLEAVPGRRVDSWDIWIDGEEVFVIPEPVEELGERAMRVVSQPALLEKLVEEASGCRESLVVLACWEPGCGAANTPHRIDRSNSPFPCSGAYVIDLPRPLFQTVSERVFSKVLHIEES